MITIKRIKREASIASFNSNNHDAFFFGAIIDQRTESIENEINTSPRFNVIYDKDKYSLVINGVAVKVFNLHSFFKDKPFKKILLDATSLGFPELLYLLNGLNLTGSNFEITLIYVEPLSYRKEKTDRKEGEFNLSDRNHKFVGLPSFSIDSQSNPESKATLVTFLGFENSRLGQLLEYDDGASYNKLLAHFAVPAFKPGWENTSLRRHLKYFNQVSSELVIHSGSNPYSINNLLTELYYNNTKLVISPLGTKPTAVGVCVFLVNNFGKNELKKQAGAIYDFPQKSKHRSGGIGKVYSYQLNISNPNI
ncbi:hypothetical protein [Pectobacterium brasiliense]|uniref:hypothetical protein n=1 Tax=Pectobacterium brasiliense TaxID=180957 RepID=UPI0025A0D99B|nr:hypothetical protein [Pectobacterium brasiliense]WJM81638.1 hypothetical protein QTI90_02445 [Pectobacterium brasiliense]